MAVPKRYGSGWHGEKVRHSRAKRLGKAGGTYATSGVNVVRLPKTCGIQTTRPLQDKIIDKVSKNNQLNQYDKGMLTHLMRTRFKGEGSENYIDEWATRIKTGFPERYADDRTLKSIKDYRNNVSLKYHALEHKTLEGMKDTDGDGVPDKLDCQPLNPKAQGTNAEVMQAFANGRKDSSGSLRSDGDVIYSYNTPIAVRRQDGVVEVTTSKHSVTTAKQITQLKRELGSFKESTQERIDFLEKADRAVDRSRKDLLDVDPVRPSQTIDISDLKRRNDKGGFHFFEKSNMRFFDSKVGRNAYVDKTGKKAYFVTSEQFRATDGSSEPRKWTVRSMNLATGSTNTEGEFNKIPTSSEAVKEAKRLAKG